MRHKTNENFIWLNKTEAQENLNEIINDNEETSNGSKEIFFSIWITMIVAILAIAAFIAAGIGSFIMLWCAIVAFGEHAILKGILLSIGALVTGTGVMAFIMSLDEEEY